MSRVVTELPRPSSATFETAARDEAVPDTASAVRRIRDVDGVVEALVASWLPEAATIRDRRWHRVGYERPMLVHPLGDDATTPVAAPLLATGRDLSPGGLSFAHATPLPNRFVAVTFPLDGDAEVSLVAQLTWCRFTRSRTYLSGGNFLRVIPTPVSLAAAAAEFPPRPNG